MCHIKTLAPWWRTYMNWWLPLYHAFTNRLGNWLIIPLTRVAGRCNRAFLSPFWEKEIVPFAFELMFDVSLNVSVAAVHSADCWWSQSAYLFAWCCSTRLCDTRSGPVHGHSSLPPEISAWLSVKSGSWIVESVWSRFSENSILWLFL